MKQQFYIIAPIKTKISFCSFVNICIMEALFKQFSIYKSIYSLVYIKGLPCKSRIDSSRLSKRLTQFSRTSPLKITKYLWMTNKYCTIFENFIQENFCSKYQVVFVCFWTDVHKTKPQVQFIHTQNSLGLSF